MTEDKEKTLREEILRKWDEENTQITRDHQNRIKKSYKRERYMKIGLVLCFFIIVLGPFAFKWLSEL